MASGLLLRPRRIPWLAGAALLAALMWFGGTATLSGESRGADALLRVLMHLPGPAAWMLSALGLGVMCVRLLRLGAVPWPVALALGCASLLTIDCAAGTLGVFSRAQSRLAAGALLVPGVVLLWRSLALQRRGVTMCLRVQTADAAPAGAWLLFASAPALAALLLAAAGTPGWIWSTEFGGYDAISYHLLLPREWMALGGITSLPHNIYSALPSFMESAFMHLMALQGGAAAGALHAQVLHALFTVAAACMVGEIARLLLGREPWTAAVLLLGVPWVIVTGSLAYDEMAMMLLFAALLWGVLFAWEEHPSRTWTVALALLAAAAIGVKMTAALFVVAPTALLWLWRAARPQRGAGPSAAQTIVSMSIAACVGALVLSPWWLRTAAATGSPLFPALGDGGLGEVRAQVFHAAHGALPVAEWPRALWSEFVGAGLGNAPESGAPGAGAPWRAFWSVLPWMAAVSACVLLTSAPFRRTALLMTTVLGVQLALWLLLTHAKGRFLLPTAVPMVLLVSLAISRAIPPRSPLFAMRTALCALLALWCAQPLWCYVVDGPRIEIDVNGRKEGRLVAAEGIGIEKLFSGEVGEDSLPASLRALPTDARVVTLGANAVFWWPTVPTYASVWNEHPLIATLEATDAGMDAARAALRTRGWTHVVIDEVMLNVWRRSGWLDPRITPERVRALCLSLKPIRVEAGGSLFELPD